LNYKNLFIVFVLLVGNLNAQNKVGLNHQLAAVKKGENPIYYLEYQLSEANKYTIQLFYKEGNLLMRGTSMDSLANKLIGNATWYYKNGNIQSEGEYNNGQKQGTWIRYNEDGSRKPDRHYSEVNMGNIIFNSALYMPKPMVDYENFEAYIKAMILKNRQFELLAFSPLAIQFIVTNKGVIKDRKYDDRLTVDEMGIIDSYIDSIPSWKPGSNGTQNINVRMNYSLDLSND
jgi:hypothetical protein